MSVTLILRTLGADGRVGPEVTECTVRRMFAEKGFVRTALGRRRRHEDLTPVACCPARRALARRRVPRPHAHPRRTQDASAGSTRSWTTPHATSSRCGWLPTSARRRCSRSSRSRSWSTANSTRSISTTARPTAATSFGSRARDSALRSSTPNPTTPPRAANGALLASRTGAGARPHRSGRPARRRRGEAPHLARALLPVHAARRHPRPRAGHRPRGGREGPRLRGRATARRSPCACAAVSAATQPSALAVCSTRSRSAISAGQIVTIAKSHFDDSVPVIEPRRQAHPAPRRRPFAQRKSAASTSPRAARQSWSARRLRHEQDLAADITSKTLAEDEDQEDDDDADLSTSLPTSASGPRPSRRRWTTTSCGSRRPRPRSSAKSRLPSRHARACCSWASPASERRACHGRCATGYCRRASG